MTNVSKNPVKKIVQNKIEDQFTSIIVNLKNKKQANLFLNELLTESESVMLFKRLAIIFMLSEDFPPSVISRTLKVSRDTVLRIYKVFARNGYVDILKEIKKKHNKKIFWDELEVLFRMGMPEMGAGRWKGLNKRFANK